MELELKFWLFEPHFLINFFLIKKTCSPYNLIFGRFFALPYLSSKTMIALSTSCYKHTLLQPGLSLGCIVTSLTKCPRKLIVLRDVPIGGMGASRPPLCLRNITEVGHGAMNLACIWRFYYISVSKSCIYLTIYFIVNCFLRIFLVSDTVE